MLNEIKAKLLAILAKLNSLAPMSEPTQNGLNIYNMAKSFLGKQVIPLTVETDFGVLGCAASVNAVVKKATGEEIGGGASTALMLAFLMDQTRFESVLFANAQPGDIVIAATGKSSFFPQSHGHVGICGKQWIMSNDSETGTWQANYTYGTWKSHFSDQMGFPLQVFRML